MIFLAVQRGHPRLVRFTARFRLLFFIINTNHTVRTKW